MPTPQTLASDGSPGWKPSRHVQTGGDIPGDSVQADAGGADLRNDNKALGFTSKIFLITVQGALKVVTSRGRTITYPSGTFLPNVQYLGEWTKIFATGTTATGIWLWMD